MGNNEKYSVVTSDLFGTIVKDGKDDKDEVVSFLKYEKAEDSTYYRIPQDKYNQLYRNGLSKNEIIEKYAQSYSSMRKQNTERMKNRRKKYIHNLYELLMYMELVVDPEIIDSMINGIKEYMRNYKKYPRIKHVRKLLPPALEMVFVARASNDIRNEEDPQVHLERYCKHYKE